MSHAQDRLKETHGRTESYLICGTPRTGSTLLCGLLDSTGVAGHPESYFRQPDEQSLAAKWGIARSPDGVFDYADYVRAAVAAGRLADRIEHVLPDLLLLVMWSVVFFMAAYLSYLKYDVM